jgi:signal transduction histidine kinase
VLDALQIDRPCFQPGSIKAYLIAALIVAVATLLRLMIAPWAEGWPYVLFFPATILTIFLCGSAAGFFAFALSVAAAWLVVLPAEPVDTPFYKTMVFCIGTITVMAVIVAMRSGAASIRRLNETLRVSEEKLREASKAKSDFLASISHELRTPLNAIIGFSELIRDAVAGPLDARYRAYGADINESGRHLQNIINDILDISKIERGRLDLRDEVVSIADTIEACRRIVEPMAADAGVSLMIENSAALPLIHSDQLRFRQILLNLMSNAVKFTPAGGRVIVSAGIEPDGPVIAVKDTGIGMKEADIALALEPFRQIDGALSRRFTGTGLGLPLAKALAELHGGRLDIESVPGIGTTVRIRLPAARIINVAA